MSQQRIKTGSLAEIQLVSVSSLNRDFYLDFLALQDHSAIPTQNHVDDFHPLGLDWGF